MIPIIKVEIDHIKQTMHHAFSEHMLKMDVDFQKAVEQALNPERIEKILNDAAEKYIEEAINDEVKSFFSRGGEGRKIIKEKVIEKLSTDPL